MDNLQSIKQQLIERISPALPKRQGIACVQAEIETDLNLLSWLKGQKTYPQFYLNFRDSTQVVAAIGQVRGFSQLNQAQAFMLQSGYPLVGGVQFYGESQFFLPRLYLQQQENKLNIQLFIDQTKNIEQERQACLNALKTFEKSTALCPIQQSIHFGKKRAEQREWCEWVEKGLQHIKQGVLNKIVLANETLFQSEGKLNAYDFLGESERYNFGCYHFLFAETEKCIFIGSSPERLYQRQGSQLRTEALAGTALVGENAQETEQQAQWLLQDEKNIYENQLVVDDIKQHLAPYSQHITVSPLGLKTLRQVQHLRRQISAQITPEYGDDIFLNAIHPTAAVAGLGRNEALAFLRQTETFDRRWYAGTLGVMQKEWAEFCVAIRSAFIEQEQIRVFAGAGIVEGSIPLLEWQEIERKALGLISLLQE
ncbi:isochorismate synthase [Avibacterium avium]|uniref:isochorismate synthase n=1 Tax=Avibacterium avium TaxID=751 RepID=UPI003BF8E2D2